MTKEELAQFTELAKKFEAKDLEEVKTAIQTHAHPVFQDINDGGRRAANTDSDKKVKDAEKKAETEKARADKAQADLDDLNGKAPDAAVLRRKYEADLAQTRKEYEDKLTAKDREFTTERLKTAQLKLADKLDKLGINKEYAETIVVNRDAVKNRIQFVDGQIRVLKAGSSDVHIVPAADKDGLDHLAEELAPTIDTTWRNSKVKRGSGMTGNESDVTVGNAKEFDDIRKEVTGRSEAKKEAEVKAPSGIERLRGRAAV